MDPIIIDGEVIEVSEASNKIETTNHSKDVIVLDTSFEQTRQTRVKVREGHSVAIRQATRSTLGYASIKIARVVSD